MNKDTALQGSCMCGVVKFSARQTSAPHACHCQMCRKHHGTAFHSVPCAELSIDKDTEFVQTFPSSKWAHRGFCSKCGSGLFYATNNGEFCGVSMGCLDTPAPTLHGHIYIDCGDVDVDHQPDFWDDLPKMTAREFLDSLDLGALYDHHTPAIADMSKPHHDGGCLCGGVRFRTTNRLDSLLICHCGQCRKQSSSYYRATETIREDFTLLKQDTLRWFHSSEDAERGFCGDCGSTLFWRKTSKGHGYRGENTGISILHGAFDERLPLKLEAHIFTKDASGAYPLPNTKEA